MHQKLLLFTSSLSQVDGDGALSDVLVAVIGKADTGVILSISGGTQVSLTVYKVDDDGALGDMLVAVIGKADAGVILSISEGF